MKRNHVILNYNQNRKGEGEKQKEMQWMNIITNLVEINPTISITALNVNGLNR